MDHPVDSINTDPAELVYGPEGGALLTRETEAGDASGGRDYESEGQVPGDPEGYDLVFSERTEIDADLLGIFKTQAHEIGLTLGQAQKLGRMYEQHVAEARDSFERGQADAYRRTVDQWEAEIKARPGFRGDLDDAQRAFKQFGTDKLVEVMDQTFIGSHPEVFDFFVKVGRALREPQTRGRGAGGRELDPAKIIYPNHN